MIPAEQKAIETFYKYNTIVSQEFTSDTLKSATIALKCAIAEIEEILKNNLLTSDEYYYQQVKSELEKL